MTLVVVKAAEVGAHEPRWWHPSREQAETRPPAKERPMTKRSTKPKTPSPSTDEFSTVGGLRSTLSPGDVCELKAGTRYSAVYIGELQGGPVFRTQGGSHVWPAMDARCRIVSSPNAGRRSVVVEDDGPNVDPLLRGVAK